MDYFYLSCWCLLAIFFAGGSALAAAPDSEQQTPPLAVESVSTARESRPPALVLDAAEREWLRAHPVLRVTADPAWAPVEFVDEQGQPGGISADYLAHMEKLLGIRFEMVKGLSWDEAEAGIKSGSVDLFSALTPTPQRLAYLNFTDTYFSTPVAIFGRVDSDYIGSLEALRGEKVLCEGRAAEELLRRDYPEIHTQVVASVAEAVRRLAEGDGRAFVGSVLVAGHYLAKQGLSNLKIIGETPYRYDLALAVSKDQPRLQRILQKALAAVPAGERSAIHARWTMVKYEAGISRRQFLWWLLGIGGSLGLLLAGVILWNRRLEAEIKIRLASQTALAAEISERKRAENTLRKLSRAVEQSYSTIVITDADANIEFVNPAFTQHSGYSAAEAMGQNPRILQSGQHSPEFYLEMWKVLTGGQVWQGELHNKRKDGTLYWEFATISPVKNERGQITHYVAVKENISVRKQAEVALRESEQRLLSLIEALPDAVFFKDGEGRWQVVNSAGLALFQLQNLPWQNKTDRQLAELQPELESAYDACIASDEAAWRHGTASQVEEIVHDEQGNTYYFDVTKVPLFTDAGTRKALVIIGRNVTERKQAEHALQQSKEAAETANRAKSAFLANMSHELRTPLNAILGFAQILAKDPDLSPAQQNAIQSIRRGGDYLLTLINDILDLTKIEAGRFELFPQAWNTGSFFHNLSDMFRIRAEQKDVMFRYREVSPLPHTLYCDDKRLRQIAMNLLSNAVKFTDKGSVTLRAEFADGTLVLEVTDTGIGIDPAQLGHIFEPFMQIGDSYHKQQGTGLGLSISHRLVQAMAGELTVNSRPGEGSVFRVRIPMEAVSTLDDSVPAAGQPVAAGYRRTRGHSPLRVLIVDDVADNREVLQSLLEPLGFVTKEAADGRQCLTIVHAWGPDLILMDVRMPVMDGLQATRALRQLPALREVPVIAVTAGAFAEDRGESIAAGCNAHIAKPVQLTELLDVLGQWLPLTWVYAENTAEDSQENKAQSLSAEEVGVLAQAISRGDISGLMEFITDLETRQICPALTRKIKLLANAFNIKELRNLVESLKAQE